MLAMPPSMSAKLEVIRDDLSRMWTTNSFDARKCRGKGGIGQHQSGPEHYTDHHQCSCCFVEGWRRGGRE